MKTSMQCPKSNAGLLSLVLLGALALPVHAAPGGASPAAVAPGRPQQPTTAAPQGRPRTFGPGLQMAYTYPAKGARFEVSIVDANTLEFKGVEGPVKGFSARVAYAATPVVDGVTLLHWSEPNGAQMVMVLNLATNTVHAREVRDGKMMVLDGTVDVRQEASPTR